MGRLKELVNILEPKPALIEFWGEDRKFPVTKINLHMLGI